MSLNEAGLLARLTWFVGAVMFAIGFIYNVPDLLIGAGLAICGGIISMALLAGKKG